MRAVLLFTLIVVPGMAQGQGGPLSRTAEHERLDFLVGEWQTTVAPLQEGGEQLHGVMSCAWRIGGLWLEERIRLEFPGRGVRESLELITYDPSRKMYVGTWQDNLSARSTPFVGEWLEDGTFVMTANLQGADGNSVSTTVRYTRISDTEIHMEQFVTTRADAPRLVFKQVLRKTS